MRTEVQKERIRALAEALDRHRKDRQALHADLTVTDMYNVLEKLRTGDVLTTKDRAIHEKGLVSILRQLHDDLDKAVADAYGWPADLPDAEILERLVSLNAERAAEEARGFIRYLRPEYQNPGGTQQTSLDVPVTAPKTASQKADRNEWPATLPERVQAIKRTLEAEAAPLRSEDIGKRFKGARKADVSAVLETLELLGLIRHMEDGQYIA